MLPKQGFDEAQAAVEELEKGNYGKAQSRCVKAQSDFAMVRNSLT
jgi:hypothetical protein